MNSPSLVRRIIVSNPQHPDLVRNHDFADNGNTSLHLAAKLGLVDIAVILLEHGHEAHGVSRNTAGETCLMIDAQAGPDEDSSLVRDRLQVAKLIIQQCPEAVHIRDKLGKDAFLHASSHGTLGLMNLLLTLPLPRLQSKPKDSDFADSPATTVPPTRVLTAQDYYLSTSDTAGNTALHLASAAGELKTVRLLISLGADERAVNTAGWLPEAYSASVSAEVYLKGLVREREANKVLNNISRAPILESGEKKRGQVRVVPKDDNE